MNVCAKVEGDQDMQWKEEAFNKKGKPRVIFE